MFIRYGPVNTNCTIASKLTFFEKSSYGKIKLTVQILAICSYRLLYTVTIILNLLLWMHFQHIYPFILGKVIMQYSVKWGVSPRWLFEANSAWGSKETMTIVMTHPTLQKRYQNHNDFLNTIRRTPFAEWPFGHINVGNGCWKRSSVFTQKMNERRVNQFNQDRLAPSGPLVWFKRTFTFDQTDHRGQWVMGNPLFYFHVERNVLMWVRYFIRVERVSLRWTQYFVSIKIDKLIRSSATVISSLTFMYSRAHSCLSHVHYACSIAA